MDLELKMTRHAVRCGSPVRFSSERCRDYRLDRMRELRGGENAGVGWGGTSNSGAQIV